MALNRNLVVAATALGGACAVGACLRPVSAQAAARVTVAERTSAWYPAGLLRSVPLPREQWSALQRCAFQSGVRAIGWSALNSEPGNQYPPTHATTTPHAATAAVASAASATATVQRFAVILLNTEEGCGSLLCGGTAAAAALTRLWAHAIVVVVADGAANHLYDSAGDEQRRRAMLPHCITGDLDSIRPDVLEFYVGCGVEIVKQPCQESHDFQKSIAVATQHLSQVNFAVPPSKQGTHSSLTVCRAGCGH